MSVSGKYILESNENYSQWLVAVGIPADVATKMEGAKPQLEVTQNGNDIAIKTIAGDKNFTNTISLGKPSKAALPSGVEYTLNVTMSGNTIKGSYTFGGKTGEATIVLSDSGFVQTTKLGDITAKRVYKRQ